MKIEIIVGDESESILVALVITVYLYVALKRIYRQPVGITILKVILSVIGLFLINKLYKFILFSTVYYIT